MGHCRKLFTLPLAFLACLVLQSCLENKSLEEMNDLLLKLISPSVPLDEYVSNVSLDYLDNDGSRTHFEKQSLIDVFTELRPAISNGEKQQFPNRGIGSPRGKFTLHKGTKTASYPFYVIDANKRFFAITIPDSI